MLSIILKELKPAIQTPLLQKVPQMIELLREYGTIIEYSAQSDPVEEKTQAIKAIQEQLHQIQPATVGAAGAMVQNHPQSAEWYRPPSPSASPEFTHKRQEERLPLLSRTPVFTYNYSDMNYHYGRKWQDGER